MITLKDVTKKLKKGDYVFIGDNGAGKSTLLKLWQVFINQMKVK